jgi:hypothetical protein
MNRLWRRFVSDESGAVAIMVAVAFPVFLLAGVLAVDVSRWNVHKRQLQTQADAAALAGGAAWRFPCNATTESDILNAAKRYSGDATFGTGRVNLFNDIPDSRHNVLYDSPTWFGGRNKSDSGGMNLTGHPCTDGGIDVKVTENDVKAFFGLFNAKYIDANARVQLKTATSVLKASPIGVPMPAPTHVYAQFVNQSNSNAPYTVTGPGVLADGKTFQLSAITGTSNPVLWQSSTVTPQGVQAGDKIGVRAALDANSTVPTTPDCSAAGIECDSNEGTTWGTLESLRQWPQSSPDAATDPAPYVTALRLTSGTCPDPYFANVPVSPAAGCTMTINATVKFNSTSSGNKQSVSAIVPGINKPVVLLNTGGNNWQGVNAIPVAPNSGRSSFALNVEQSDGHVDATNCTNNGNNPAICKLNIPDAQRVFGANSLNSGYIQRIQVDQPGVQSFANSLAACSTTLTTTCSSYGLTVTIGVMTLHIAPPGERPVTLRILKDTTGNASKNGSLNCDTAAGTTLTDELANGCNIAYREAVGNECDSVHQFADMAANPPNPYPCVQEKPGESKQSVNKAMKLRILGGTNQCTGLQDNQWTAGSPDNLPAVDPRRIDVFLTDFGIFTGSGRDFAPVRGFAEFYVTGWSGQEKGNPDNNGNGNNNSPICSNNDPAPADQDGYLVGHFVKAVAPPGVQENDQVCDPTALDLCTPVLTR